jgi:acetoin utilization deacetylase AcuC-like enzyme
MIEQRLLPPLRAFNPDLILISAGFDGGKNDVGNARHDKAWNQGLDLSVGDYFWVTQKIQEVAACCCDGRIVSVLEVSNSSATIARS